MITDVIVQLWLPKIIFSPSMLQNRILHIRKIGLTLFINQLFAEVWLRTQSAQKLALQTAMCVTLTSTGPVQMTTAEQRNTSLTRLI